ncbi:MAG: beta-lactamase family protein, partial [Acidimicrobiia bacterium]|nr:beta-lactamase family protein [Acidimicrobiia bacterium]
GPDTNGPDTNGPDTNGTAATAGGAETNSGAATSGTESYAAQTTGSGPIPPAAGGLVPLPAQPDGVAFPTDAWPEAELGERLDPAGVAAVTAVVDAAFDGSESYGRIQAVLIVAGGQLVLERYGRGYSGDEPHVSWSVAKSVTHAMLGILTRDGQLDVTAPASVPEWSSPGDPRAQITPDMLARMSSGLAWNEPFDAFALVTAAAQIEAATRQAERELAGEPDTAFNYSTGSTAINGRLIGERVGTGDEFRSWADAELFAPLGIDSVELELDGSGYFIAGYGANMTARDFARFGLLYQRDGVWDGRRILPEGWVDYARSPSSTSEGYGSGFWLVGDTFSAAGFAGQRVVMVPEHDLIVVVLADELNDGPIGRLLVDLVTPFDDG